MKSVNNVMAVEVNVGGNIQHQGTTGIRGGT